MKKTTILMLALMLTCQWSVARDYAQFVKQGKKWVYYDITATAQGDIYTPIVFEINGDTVVGGHSYSKVYRDAYVIGDDVNTVEHVNHLYGLLREEDSPTGRNARVYARCTAFPPLLGIVTGKMTRGLGYEYQIFDWERKPNDFFDDVPKSNVSYSYFYFFLPMTQIEVNGTMRDCYQQTEYRYLIEGMGMIQDNFINRPPDYPVAPVPIYDFMNYRLHGNNQLKQVFSHLIEDGEIVYKGELYDFFIENDYITHHSGNVAVDDIDAEPVTIDGAYYDMQGRRMAEPTAPGIYIHNGKKVVIK